MDASLYKDIKTSRGYTYHYYAKSAEGTKPTLLFLHGFPSTSYDWHHQVAYFGSKGYGLIVPDLLGYGGSDKPEEGKEYGPVAIAQDVMDILDAERIDKAIGIGHDWGCTPLSRLSMLHADRFLGFAWLAVHFQESVEMHYETMIATLRQAFGYDVFGYWSFFDSPDAAGLIEKHIDSFLELVYANDAALWKDWVAPTGKFRQWVGEDRRTERAAYLTDEDYQHMRSSLLAGGLKGPLLWYTCLVHNLQRAADKEIPEANWAITKPAFFGAALRDCVCLPVMGKTGMPKHAPPELLTIVDFDTSHWIQIEAPQRLNEELEKWMAAFI